MKITNTLNIIALLLSLLLFVGCEKDVSDEQLRVSPEIIEIGCEGGIVQVDIGSTSSWKVVVPSNCTWVKSDRYEGEGGHRQWIKLTISKNNTKSTRKATITISNRGKSHDITITQLALSFDVTPESIDVGIDKTTQDITINSNISWSAKTSDSWFSLSKSSGNAGSSKITVTIAKNTTGDTRTGHVEIYNNNQNVSKKVVITQKVASLTIDPKSINVGAEAVTRNVTVTSDIDWMAKTSANWIILSKNSGYAGTTTLTINIGANTLTSSRSGYVEFYNSEYNVSKKVDINQIAFSPELSVSPNSFDVGAEATTKTVTIESNFSWTAKTSSSWIYVSKLSGSVGTTALTIEIDANTSTSSRSGYVEFYNTEYKLSKKVYINQYLAEFIETIESLNMKMIFVEGGTFAMGSNDGDDDEKPVHNVTLDSYYIGETEITQAQWRAIMGYNPSEYTGDYRPVECVSWEGVQKFCKKLSELTGKRYVLPTEAQWEYAARGGNKSKGYKYSGSDNVDDVAVYDTSSHSNVKSKKPNELGIYDMSGNVWEWCSDWYDSSYYSLSPQANPQGPTSGSARVLRGASWDFNSSYFRVAIRGAGNPSGCNCYNGFRVVCIP